MTAFFVFKMSACGFSKGFAQLIKSTVEEYTPETALKEFEEYFTEKLKTQRAGTAEKIHWKLPEKFLRSPRKQECLQAIADSLIALGCQPITLFNFKNCDIRFAPGNFAFLILQEVPHCCNANFCQKDGCPRPNLITCDIRNVSHAIQCSAIVFCMMA